MTADGVIHLDPAALATAAGTALVAAMATDAWEKTSKEAVSLWRRVHPDRTAAIEAELAEVRGEVLEARRQNDVTAEEDLAREWRRRLLRLLQQDIDLVPELQRVLNETWIPALGSRDRQRMTATATGHGRVNQAGRDQHIIENQHDYDYDESGINGLFQGRGPGRILILAGMVVAGFCFTGWASIVFGFARGAAPDGPGAMLGKLLPSGIPVGIVYFLGFGAGGIMMKIGSSMTKAAAKGAGTLGHFVATVVIIALAAFACTAVLAGAPLEALMPRFSR